MNHDEERLWLDIQAFRFDKHDVELPFSKRLARDNSWSLGYALRVIDEYRKFLFLCCVCNHGVTPSLAVDEAWHLHLCYTQSYWVDLCKNTLGRELHHLPTEGGATESEKYLQFYTNTFASYTHYFDEQPPPDIWLAPDKRFEHPLKSRKQDTHWHIRKPNRFTILFILGTIVCFTALAMTIEEEYRISIIGIGVVVVIVSAFLSMQRDDGTNNHALCGGCGGTGCTNDSGCSGCGGD
ncbi:MAG: hypothetical protein JNL32_11380 [Candidatus Kapabacteria bacterium]|nr:hypothetical protein [Candidatus Kapabacteria bacterium]